MLTIEQGIDGERHHAHADSPGVPNVELIAALNQVQGRLGDEEV